MGALLKFVQENFAHVFPILAAAAFAVVITVDRLYALIWKFPLVGTESFFDKVRNLVMNDRLNEAILLCERYRSKPVASVVREGLIRAHQPENLIEHGLQIAVGDAADRIQARTTFLATIANVATLLGLLGTIMGLIQSFEAVGNANPQQRSALLAAGISTAMNATMLGLGTAVPCMVLYAFLMNRSNRLNAKVERSAVRILDILKQRYYTVERVADPLMSSTGIVKNQQQQQQQQPSYPQQAQNRGGGYPPGGGYPQGGGGHHGGGGGGNYGGGGSY